MTGKFSMDYSKYYRKWHSESIEHYEAMSKYYERILRPSLPEDKEIKILDIGCAFGITMYSLKKMGYRNVKGIDINPELIAVAKSKFLDVELVDDTVAWLKNFHEEYHVVLCFDVLEHIPKEEQISFLQSIYNAMKPNGVFVCTVPNANSTFASRWRYIDYTHTISFTEHSLEFLLSHAGFSEIEIREVEFRVKPRYPFIIRKSVILWLALRFFRLIRRLEAIAELGSEGKNIPLSLNLLGIAHKK